MISLHKRLSIAVAGGLAGFCVLILAWFIFMITALAAADFPFGGGSPSFGENFILYGFVPMLISLSAAIPAWTLGAKFLLGLFAGITAMGCFILIDIVIAPPLVSYGAFNIYETHAVITTVFVSVLITLVGKNGFRLSQLAILVILTWVLIQLRSVLPLYLLEREQIIGFVISLLAWIVLPTAAAFFTMPRQKDKHVEGTVSRALL
jgi:hypothetical protein